VLCIGSLHLHSDRKRLMLSSGPTTATWCKYWCKHFVPAGVTDACYLAPLLNLHSSWNTHVSVCGAIPL
jgi:hypothetical protein